MSRRVTPSGPDAWANLRGADGPVAAVRGFASNLWFKLRQGERCCGNYGDPGC